MKLVSKPHGTHRVLFFYWVVLLLWQNVFAQQARSGIDVVVKSFLLILLSFFFLLRSQRIKKSSFLLLVLLIISETITFSLDNYVSSSAIISYTFPPLFIFLTLCIGGLEEISIKEYIQLMHWLIVVVFIMIIYSFIFDSNHFTNLSNLSTAYGNELSSFLISNLEYGMYLTFAIIGCLICLHYEASNKLRQWGYVIMIILCFFNLLFTYSRTSIVASLCAVIIYSIAANKKTIPLVLLITTICVLIYLLNPSVNWFINSIVFKNGTASGRDAMALIALDYYSREPIINKLFGLGFGNGSKVIIETTHHGSIHNGFLQLLLCNGIVGVIFLGLFLIYSFIYSIKARKNDLFFGGVTMLMSVLPIVFMMTCTSVLFYSSIDSTFLTVFSIITTRYVNNYLSRQKKASEY